MNDYQPKVGDIRRRIDNGRTFVCVDLRIYYDGVLIESPMSWWVPVSIEDKTDVYFWQAFSSRGWEEIESKIEIET